LVFVPHSSTNTKRCSASISPATRSLQAALRNSSRSAAPTRLFFGSTQAALTSVRPWRRSPARRPPAGEGTRAFGAAWPPDAPRGRPPRASWQSLAHLRLGAGALLRGERPARLERGYVALDRGNPHAKEACCLCLGHPSLESLDYPEYASILLVFVGRMLRAINKQLDISGLVIPIPAFALCS
jgi:hypothetical protein